MSLLTRVLPFLSWFKSYDRTALRLDFLAGLTVALVLIPQSMAYAQLAGLPSYYGLYAAFLPPMVAALFGSSWQLATGPVAVVSLMTSTALEPLATAGSAEYIAYAILLALLVGLFQFALGLLRLGIIVNFLSHPVVNGFTNAAALIIATSQLSKLFGVYVDKCDHHYETIYRVVLNAFDYLHWPTLGMAALAITIMVVLKRLTPKLPNVLVAVVVTTLLSWMTGFEKNEKVALSAIKDAKTGSLITAFNTAIDEKNMVEQIRRKESAALRKEHAAPARGRAAPGKEQAALGIEKLANKANSHLCMKCHTALHLSGKTHSVKVNGPFRKMIRELHFRSHLYEVHVKHLKKKISRYRQKLRCLRFEALLGTKGALRFFSMGTLAKAQKRYGGTWRLKVGTKKLDGKVLRLTGGGAVVGNIPAGLPGLMVPTIDWSVVSYLLPLAIIISMLGFMEAISIAKAMAARTHQKLNPNQELIGQGLANIIGSFGGSYAVSGSFSRSAVNLQAGARTGLSNVISTAIVVIVLLFCTPLLYHLPQAVLASVIIMAVIGLLDVKGVLHAWKAQKFDGMTAIATFMITLIFAPHLEWGIAVGVVLSLGAYLYRTMKPNLAELSLHSDGSLRDARLHGLAQCKHIAVVRFDGPLNFASTSYLEDEILKLVVDMAKLRYILIAAHGINELDASGEDMLGRLVDRLREDGYEVCFSGLKDHVLDVLHRTHLYEKIGAENMFPTQVQAIEGIYTKAHYDSKEEVCPLVNVVPL